MAVDAAILRTGARPRALARAVSVAPAYLVAAVVGVSFALRWLVALGHATPYIFPDEYIYSSVARNLAEGAPPVVREGAGLFPAFLEPLLAAPLQLAGDPELAYRLTQGLHALAMSLAAVPVYLLARRLGLGGGSAVAAAVVAVAVPDMAYASFVLAEPVAYPLALAAVYAGTRALESRSRRAQLVFLGLAGAATLARLQYALLPLAYMAAAVLVERRPRPAARAVALPLGAVALPLLALLALQPHRVIGPYAGISQWRPDHGALAGWLGADGLLLALAAGWVLVPGALVGLAAAIARPRTRAEAAFAALAAALAAGLFAESAMIADFESGRFEERYLFVLVPLAAVAFLLSLSRGRRSRWATALLAAALLVPALRVPVSGYVFGSGKVDSPFLWAVARLEQSIGVGSASLAVAAGAGALSLLAAGAALRPRRSAALVLGATIAAFAVVSAGALAHAGSNASIVRTQDLPPDAGWVDRAGLPDAILVQTPGGPRRGAMEQLFWNRGARDIVLLGGAEPFDAFPARSLRIRRDGALFVGAERLHRPLLVQSYGVTVRFASAELAARGGTFELWRPRGLPRLSLLLAGRYHDGWLARGGSIFLWPGRDGRTHGRLRLRLGMPRETQVTPLRFRGPGLDRRVAVAPGSTRLVSLPVDTCGPVVLTFETSRPGLLTDTRQVSVRAEPPTFVRARIQAAPRPCR